MRRLIFHTLGFVLVNNSLTPAPALLQLSGKYHTYLQGSLKHGQLHGTNSTIAKQIKGHFTHEPRVVP
jgi:hypothetical protein